ncbi:MAG: hypothetical protein HQL56_17670, partial [Magnetococcales bacterium]|nr:hypothetical protein [Magnetococcales bacterium]
MPTPPPDSATITPEHRRRLEKLHRLLHPLPRRFVLAVLVYGDSGYRERLMAELAAMGVETGRLEVQDDWSHPQEILQALAEFPPFLPVHVLGLGRWMTHGPGVDRFRMLNYTRNSFASEANRPLLVWLEEEETRLFILESPDMWAWRIGSYDFMRPFALEMPPLLDFNVVTPEFAWMDKEQAEARIASISRYLEGNPEPTQSVAGLL